MSYQRINGAVFERMMQGGLSNLRLHEKETNDMNVFPVPDGDTGTNMCRTIETGVRSAKSSKDLNDYLKGVSEGMLLGARGNSGVILSQIFAGFYDALTHYATADADNLLTALAKGYKWAYNSVIRPVEGTILTVIREGVDNARRQLYRKISVDTMLGILLSEMRKSLLTTPYLLPVLKEAGVVDSGGFGLVKIFEGMIKGLHGEKIEETESASEAPVPVIDGSFGENSDFTYGYCMEFLLQLMSVRGVVKSFPLNEYIEKIKQYGNSIVAVQNGTRVKVHIHTFTPENVIHVSRAYGEFVTFKLENMQLQHNEFEAAKEKVKHEHKAFALLAVADGAGFKELFEGQGCDLVIDGGKSMSTSVQEFLDAYETINADTVAVIPNDKNVVFAARQAAAMFQKSKIEILPAKNMVEGYFALGSDVPDAPEKERLESMALGMDGLTTVSVDRCSKNRVCHGVSCKEGEYAAFINGEIALAGETAISACVSALKSIEGIEEKEQIIVFKGKDFALEEELTQKLSEELPSLQVYVLNGGQSVDELMLGVM